MSQTDTGGAGRVRIGTAGWTVPSQWAEAFGGGETHLERYARRLGGVEINSSFYRSHRASTWERWARSVPAGFRFAVKAPKRVTHEQRLARCGALLKAFFAEVAALGDKLGPVLFQMPPKLAFDEALTREFLGTMREVYAGAVAMEPRHASWFEAGVGKLLREFEVARVAADPAKGGDAAARPGGWNGLVYRRMHGSPRVYYSGYPDEFLLRVADAIQTEQARGAEVWCIFDNTALGEAAGNAMQLERMLAER